MAAEVRRLLAGPPVPRPPGHEGGAEDDYLWLELPEGALDEIVEELGALEADLAETGAPPGVGAAADLLDRWNAAESSRSSGLT